MAETSALTNPTMQDIGPRSQKEKDDQLKSAQKQLKLSQKLSETIVNYIINENYQQGPDLENLRQTHDELAKEQTSLNSLIYGNL